MHYKLAIFDGSYTNLSARSRLAGGERKSESLELSTYTEPSISPHTVLFVRYASVGSLKGVPLFSCVVLFSSEALMTKFDDHLPRSHGVLQYCFYFDFCFISTFY